MAATVAGIHLGPDTHANRPAASAPPVGSFYYCSDHDLVYTTDGSSWTTWLDNSASGGAVATDAIWDAKGDLAGGTGANTASKLSVGTNDHVLTADSAQATGMKWAAVSGGGGIDSGTSFPVSPSANDLFFHETDGELYYYTGSAWHSVAKYRIEMPEPLPNAGSSVSGLARVSGPLGLDSFYLESIRVGVRVSTTNNGSNYWTVTYYRHDASTSTALGSGSFDTSGDTANVYVTKTLTINATISSAHEMFLAQGVTTGSPGNIWHSGVIYYRRVGS